MDLIGQSLGQYEIVEKIGSGGMATVYKAYQPGLDRYVAIKVLPAQHALTPGFKERFIREAKAVAKLNHPNILPVHDMGFEGDLSYFVMKLVESGKSLRDLGKRPLDLSLISTYIDQIASALDHAHERNVLHRDIKPDNILMDGEWLMLADFGLAKVPVKDQNLTDTGVIIGTPMYVSPEQVKGDVLDRRADIYSLGVVLYELAVGQVPFQSESSIGTMFKHVHDPLPSPRLFNPDLPLGVEEVIVKALAKDPAQRFAKAGELAEALRIEIAASDATPTIITDVIEIPVEPARLFISYKRNRDPDHQLAAYLADYLVNHDHEIYLDQASPSTNEWLETVDDKIRKSDFIIVLLSAESANSEMLQTEVQRAAAYRRQQGNPKTIPVRVAFDGMVPYALESLIDAIQYVTWSDEDDNERAAQNILSAMAGSRFTPSPVGPKPDTGKFSEDGSMMSDSDSIHTPLPEFDPRLLEAMEAPGGVVKLRDKFYVERQADAQLRREIVKAGTTTTIRASRQTGKSSLLVRGINHAKEHGAKIAMIDLQRMDTDRLTSPDMFLRDFAELILRKLRLDVGQVESFWRGALGPQDKLTYLIEDYVLPEIDGPIVLALDEVDRLLQLPFSTDFFGLLRSWHNSRALDEAWDMLNLVMVISTEPYMLISDVNQSPFNVGLKIYLEDFDELQMRDLNVRHGSPVADSEFMAWMKMLGGQPYLTRKALHFMVSENMRWPEFTQVAALDHGPFGDHLRRHQWLLSDEPELKAAFKQVVEHNQSSDEMALFRLLQAGLVKGSGDAYTCRCDL
ncbi:MAG: AAA-like domain-containing protein, partial [Anaerolineae bacterium]|nr:AAA-like domain-containing protein [Anaerolineae bacterium]